MKWRGLFLFPLCHVFTHPEEKSMLKRWSWLIVVSLVLTTSHIANSKPESGQLALLTDVHGSVQIVRGGSALAGKSGMRLQAGDTVRVADGSATVFYNGRPP